MNENMKDLCRNWGVDGHELLKKISDGLDGVSISHFTDEELEVLKACVILASE